MRSTLAEDVKASLRVVPNFPKPGILFQDVAPVLANPRLFERCVEAMAAPFEGRVDKVVGIESRGFILGAPLALHLGVGFVPLRKMGKLPGALLREEYALEYGTATLEIQADALRPGDRVLLVDDVLATGGTLAAAARLMARAHAQAEGASLLLEIGALNGRAAVPFDPHVILTV
ncbi:MAG TPA: adenine phosphoribosyltransferase [Candidatus Thermoplasmatota archaeon]|nr:adenine phosphoribosyltransferase [Candidatus Thermoplasmatota archaeon]